MMRLSGFAQRVAFLAAIIAGLLTWTYAKAGTIGDPYTGTPIQINGTPGATTIIEAENFDKGGEGVAYHDLTLGNCTVGTPGCPGAGGVYRISEDVDIWSDVVGQYYLVSIHPGEWLTYTIQVNAIGAYTIELAVAFMQVQAHEYHLEIDGKRYPDVGTYSLGAAITTTWGSPFEWRGKSELIPMVPGLHRLRIIIDNGWFNWDSLRVKYAAGIEWQMKPVWRVYP
jgi:hypothetical protein